MIGFDKTITIYNKYISDKMYHKRTVLHNCYFGSSTAKVGEGTAFSTKNGVTVLIAENPKFTPTPTETFLTDDTFTLDTETTIVLLDVDDEIPPNTSANKLLEKYKGVSFQVSKFSDNAFDGLSIGHYEVTNV